MSQRERKALGAGLAAGQAAGGEAPRSGPAADRAPLLSWEELFQRAGPAQRQEMLSLIQRQGFLYYHQVSSASNGKQAAGPLEVELPQLSRLLEGNCQGLSPVQLPRLEFWDSSLDRRQREAVARSLGTPDLSLVAGLPGTGKSRVVAEIVTQAVARGERVLFLAPRAAAIDHVLGQIATRAPVCALRLLETGEKPESLSGLLRSLTLGERLRKMREAAPLARRGQEAAELRCQKRHKEKSLWPGLRGPAEQLEKNQAQQQQLRSRIEHIPLQVAAETTTLLANLPAQPALGFQASLVDEERRRQESIAEISAALARVEQAVAEKAAALAAREKEVQSLRPLVRARELGRWWSPAWWRAAWQGNVGQRLSEREETVRAAQDALAAAHEEARVLHLKKQELERDFRLALERLQEKEVHDRRARLAEQEKVLEQEAGQLRGCWQAQIEQLGEEVRPEAATVSAVEAAERNWQEHLRRDEASCAFAGQWAGFLGEAAEVLFGRLPALVNVLAGTLAARAADKQWVETPFDLLVLEEANQVSEAEFLKVARQARRWVLVGEPDWDSPAADPPEGVARNRPANFFHRLCRHLLCDSGSLPYAWTTEGERLCCRLRQVSTAQRSSLECESLADFPDIELRILSLPGKPPVLAEVVFPPSLSIFQAKEYIYKELQELPVQPAGRSGCLLEESDRFVFHLADIADQETAAVALEGGIHEFLVAAHGCSSAQVTCRFEFDKKTGWKGDTVAAWLDNHLRLKDPGRAVLLQTPYRMHPPLGAVVGEWLFGETYQRVVGSGQQPPAPQGPSLVFVPVPSLPRKENGFLPGQGAGLEIDLTAPRGLERLPAEVRTALPGRGIVNLPEARALVRRLENLVRDPGQLPPGPSAIAVLALYPAQVELLRGLVRRSALLRQSSIPVEVGLPAAFCHREFPVVLVSLTRSHGFRAVTFGEEECQVRLALTRARTQLILFGDTGTLVRRSQWQGRLDHLDESAAGRETLLVNHLVRYLQGRGKFSHLFHLASDSC